MGWFYDLLSWNYVLVTTLCATLSAQFAKVIINLILVRKFIPERIWGAGGMPSAHSATVCSMVVATGRYSGPHSTVFAVALVVAIIVMYDAMGVRWETGKQAQILNQMIGEWLDEGARLWPLLGDQKLKEMVGHTPLQVVFGAALGIFIGLIMPAMPGM